jgi:hypothetical protein
VGLDPYQDLQFLERLGKVVDAARSEGLDFVVGSLESTDEDDRDVPQSLIIFEPPANVQSGHFGHAEVKEYEIGRLDDRRFDGEPAAQHRPRYKTAMFQYCDQETKVLGVIVYYQDAAASPIICRSIHDFPHRPKRSLRPS